MGGDATTYFFFFLFHFLLHVSPPIKYVMGGDATTQPRKHRNMKKKKTKKQRSWALGTHPRSTDI
jgi:hypothetical protein